MGVIHRLWERSVDYGIDHSESRRKVRGLRLQTWLTHSFEGEFLALLRSEELVGGIGLTWAFAVCCGGDRGE